MQNSIKNIKNLEMPDLQNSMNKFQVNIDKVGVRGVKHPFKVSLEGILQKHTPIANVNLYVSLDKNQRGTHMSRLIEVLHSKDWSVSYSDIKNLLDTTKQKLNSDNAYIELSSTLLLLKEAPVSKSMSYVDYEFRIYGTLKQDKFHYTLELVIPVKTLCPCSKEISEYGAHNQRSLATLTLELNEELDVREVINVIESTASSPVYGILKREDEKYITEKSYENPKFVEDMVRHSYEKLKILLPPNSKFKVQVESIESIHNHSAFSLIDNYDATTH